MWFRKKNVPDLRKQDREIIDSMEPIFDVILAKVSDDNVSIEVDKLKEMVHYLVPSPEKKIISLDQEIKNQIDDLKTDVVKEKLSVDKIIQGLKDIHVSIAQRNSRV